LNVVIIDTDDVSRNTLSLYFDSGFGLDPIEYSDFKSFRDDFKESLDFSMLAITSDISDSFLDLADCLHSMEQKVPILLFRNKVLSAKELDLLEENCRSLTKLNLPFVENEFLEAMEDIVDDLAESTQKTTPAEIEDDPKRPQEANTSPVPKADYSLKKERTEQQEVQADYSLKKERTEQQEVDADYSLKKERSEQQEVDADYSLKKEHSEQQEVDADYSLKKEHSEQQEVDADYSLKKERVEQKEVQADYSLNKINRVKQKLSDLGVKSSNTRELDVENSKSYCS
jgi:hypothetical protein